MKRDEIRDTLPQEALKVARRTIAPLDPDDLRRRSEQERSTIEVGVFRDDGKTLPCRVGPDDGVGGGFQTHIANVHDVGTDVTKSLAEAMREVLIEQQLHSTPVAMSRRSRSAAKARQARMSSRVRSGKSRTISSSDIPPAKYSRTSETVMRRPRTHGLPPRLPGSIVIRSR